MTNAGNPQARRALVEGAWASRDPATVSRHRPLRRTTPPHGSQELRCKAHGRLGKRARTLLARRTHAPPVVVAMARARVGCLGAMAPAVTGLPDGRQSGGTHATARRRSARRRFLAPALPRPERQGKAGGRQEMFTQDLTSEVISTLTLSGASASERPLQRLVGPRPSNTSTEQQR
jgi:hypothetical protein